MTKSSTGKSKRGQSLSAYFLKTVEENLVLSFLEQMVVIDEF